MHNTKKMWGLLHPHLKNNTEKPVHYNTEKYKLMIKTQVSSFLLCVATKKRYSHLHKGNHGNHSYHGYRFNKKKLHLI